MMKNTKQQLTQNLSSNNQHKGSNKNNQFNTNKKYRKITIMSMIFIFLFCFREFDFSYKSIYWEKSGLKGFETKFIALTRKSIKFMFVIGLEGTGHHFLASFSFDSPAVQTLRRLDIYPEKLKNVQLALFRQDQLSHEGIWSAFCSRQSARTNVTLIQENIVKGLQEIRQIAMNDSEIHNELIIPINTVYKKGYKDASREFGMASYPNFLGECRNLQYPNLDILYDACDLAGVECEHIYLYRDPSSVIASTTMKRRFNKSVLQAFHLYITHLSIIYAQLSLHSKRNIGCFGFYDNDLTYDELWQPIKSLFGWTNQTEFDTHAETIFKPPEALLNNNSDQQEDLIPPQLIFYLQSINTLHNKVIQLCRQQVARRGLAPSLLDIPKIPSPSSSKTKKAGSLSNTNNDYYSVKFTFVIGLYGAGHDSLRAILKHSSLITTLTNQNRVHQDQLLVQLQEALYNTQSKYKGLWSAQGSLAETNITDKVHRVATLLHEISNDNNNNHLVTGVDSKNITIPINLFEYHNDNVSMMSYPTNFNVPYAIDYANLDLLYEACEIANVYCNHLYIYKHPKAMIEFLAMNDMHDSKNNDNNIDGDNNGASTMMRRIQSLLTHQYVIFTQLSTHTTRLVGCHDMTNNKNNNSIRNATFHWLQDAFGISIGRDAMELNENEKSNHKMSSSMTMTYYEDALVQYKPYIDSMIKAHEHTLQLCRKRKYTKPTTL